MKYVIAGMFDSATMAFNRPVFVRAIGEAVRIFTDEVNRMAPDNPMHAHSEHFALYELGTFDDSDAKFETFYPAKLVVPASAVKAGIREE